MAPPRRITRDSLKRAPRELLPKKDQLHAEDLLLIEDKRPWTEPELRRAAALEMKAWALKNGTWRE